MRLPAFAHSVIDQDESLYLILGNELLGGHLPGTRLFDYKPLFLFTLFAASQAVFADGILAIRVLGVLCVSVSAFLLSRAFVRVFPGALGFSAVAGLLYLVLTVANGGLATNAEIVLHPFLLGGTLLLLRTFREDAAVTGVTRSCFTAGLLLGLGYQIKPVIVFDIIGLFVFCLFMRLSRNPGTPAAVTETLRTGIVSFAGFCVPLFATVLIYVFSGSIDAWKTMLRYGVAGAAQPLELWRLRLILEGLSAFAVLMPLVALSAAKALSAADRDESFAVRGLLSWTAVTAAGVVLAGFYFGHHFLLLVPTLSLVASHGFCLAWRQTGLSPGCVVVSTTLAVSTFVMALLVSPQAYIEAGTVFAKRLQTQDRFYGDLPRRLAAHLGRESKPEDTIYIHGYHPILYYLTGSPVPTRFPFSDHVTYEYSANILTALGFDLTSEMDETMSRRPRFVILASDRRYKRTAATERLMVHLVRDYEFQGIFLPDRGLTTAYGGASGGALVYKRKGTSS